MSSSKFYFALFVSLMIVSMTIGTMENLAFDCAELNLDKVKSDIMVPSKGCTTKCFDITCDGMRNKYFYFFAIILLYRNQRMFGMFLANGVSLYF